jgi:transposase
MSVRGPYRRHSPPFKMQLCTDIRDGKLGRREAQKTYRISATLIHLWLSQYDLGELDQDEAAACTMAEHEAKIAALERKVSRLTMELDLVKKTAHLSWTLSIQAA